MLWESQISHVENILYIHGCFKVLILLYFKCVRDYVDNFHRFFYRGVDNSQYIVFVSLGCTSVRNGNTLRVRYCYKPNEAQTIMKLIKAGCLQEGSSIRLMYVRTCTRDWKRLAFLLNRIAEYACCKIRECEVQDVLVRISCCSWCIQLEIQFVKYDLNGRKYCIAFLLLLQRCYAHCVGKVLPDRHGCRKRLAHATFIVLMTYVRYWQPGSLHPANGRMAAALVHTGLRF